MLYFRYQKLENYLEQTLQIRRSVLSSTSTFEVKIAETLQEIEAALRLRFEVFNLEMKEGLQSSFETGFDSDVYDTFCDHLIVKEIATGAVVGTYRLLPQNKAEHHIGFYSENEFDMTMFKSISGQSLELGRSCVAKAYRSLAVINLLWTGIARYLERREITHLFGCASFHTNNAKEMAAAFAYLKLYHSAPDKYQVTPLPQCTMNLPFQFLTSNEIEESYRKFPPLMKGYLRLGAMICGEPAYDKEFGTVDFLIILEKEQITNKYKDHYISASVAA